MTETTIGASTDTSTPRHPLIRVVTRIPATLTLVLVVIAAGIAWEGLWRPFSQSDLLGVVAYGLPALLEGRWWTPITGTFFVNEPWVYSITLLSFVGMAYLEFRRGSRVALGYFAIGQLFAVLASALFLAVFSLLPWPWAIEQAAVLDAGPSGGTFACLAAAASLLPSPWRLRAWLVLIGGALVALLFWGSLADLEHAFALGLVLGVDRPLQARRTTIREQRFIAFLALLALGAVEILTLLAPTDGPFGPADAASGSFADVVIDVLIIALIATGLRRGRRWAWVVSLILAIFNTLVGLLLVVVIWIADIDKTALDADPVPSMAQAGLWTALLIYLIWARHAFRAHRKAVLGVAPAPDTADAVAALRSDGGGTLSWMTTWSDMLYARTSTGIVAYQKRNGVALALADPLGPASGRAQSVTEFISVAERAGLVPCFFSASEATRAAVPDSWRSIVVADDTIVDLPGLRFTGKAWGDVRTALNRAGREEVTFRLTRLVDEPWGIQAQIRAISEMWVGDKDLPEMGFTLGTLDEARDREVRLALAVSTNGDVDGFLSWLPVYGPEGTITGWTLDLMRRRDGGFGPVMEFLIGSSAKQFSEEGALIMSLSGAPLTHDYPEDAGLIGVLSDKLAESLEPVYGFRSLHRFKEKFHPRYETMYLLYRDESDLARIGAGLVRAFLPDASLRQFAGAGIELVRGENV